MESVRKGKGLKEEWKEEMRAHNVPAVSYTHLDVYKRQQHYYPVS